MFNITRVIGIQKNNTFQVFRIFSIPLEYKTNAPKSRQAFVEFEMSSDANLQLLILGTMCVFSWLMVKLVRYTKTKRINTELWCTVFEGLTQGAIRLDDLKTPEAVIEKKIRRDGKDKDSFDLSDMEIKTNSRTASDKGSV